MTIKDELLEPYYIDFEDSGCYNIVLYEVKHTDPTHHLSRSEESKERDVPVGYFSDMGSILKKIIFLKLARQNEVITLKEYLQRYTNLVSEFSKFLQ